MIPYVSTRGGSQPVGFDMAVLAGFADDGGLFVPERIPVVTEERLAQWKNLSYPALAHEVLSLFISPEIIPDMELKDLIRRSFAPFEHRDIMPLVRSGSDENLYFMELFHGPTLSFKDIAMGFLVNTMDYLLGKRGEHRNLILATTGDTGPAAAHAAAGKKTLDCWPLFPKGMITAEQERQMTTLAAGNVHPVGVTGCPDGGDDLDVVVARLFSDPGRKLELELSSVNSINWCRVLVQSIHYIFAYLRVCGNPGSPVAFSVPSGAFGNLFAGFLAREMGVPIHTFICANNANQTLHTTFSTGIFRKRDLVQTVSSAIDIVVPYNFWRFLYFMSGCDNRKLTAWMDRFSETGEVRLDPETLGRIREGYASCCVSDRETLAEIRNTWETSGYLLDPHGAVAVSGARRFAKNGRLPMKTVCLLTAHPAKFPGIIRMALGETDELPKDACHPSLVRAEHLPETGEVCHLTDLEDRLIAAMKTGAVKRRG